jgi:hypothetical protein
MRIFLMILVSAVAAWFLFDPHFEKEVRYSGDPNFFQKVDTRDPLSDFSDKVDPSKYHDRPGVSFHFASIDELAFDERSVWPKDDFPRSIESSPVYYEKVKVVGNFQYKNGKSVFDGETCSLNLSRGHFDCIRSYRGQVEVRWVAYDNDPIDFDAKECPQSVVFKISSQRLKQWEERGFSFERN